MAFSWILDRKKQQYVTQVANLPYYMVVYAQEGHNNTVVVTCRSGENGPTGNLTYANSILSGKIQAEELIDTGRWIEYAPEYMQPETKPAPPKKTHKPKFKKPVKPKKPLTKISTVSPESLARLMEHFNKD